MIQSFFINREALDERGKTIVNTRERPHRPMCDQEGNT